MKEDQQKITVQEQKGEDRNRQLQPQKQQCQERTIMELRQKLKQQEEKNFVLEGFFRKVQKILFSENSNCLEGEQIENYEKLELHLSDMVRRI